MTDEIGLFEAMYTARAQRRFKPDPVPKPLITRILESATRAGSGGNAQNWAFIVVRDPELKRRLGEIYRKGSDIADAMYTARGKPAHLTEAQYRRMMTAGTELWDHMADAPVLLVPCIGANTLPPRESLPEALQPRYEWLARYLDDIRGASIFPAVQNIILACRALGLGTTITTNHLHYVDEARAALGIPGHMLPCALMPIGWPRDPFGPVSRKPLAEVAFADRWGAAWTCST